MPRIGRCDICLGRGTIKLPVYEETLACLEADEAGPKLLDDVSMISTGNSRTFPCPECAKPLIPMDIGERFTVIRANRLLDTSLIKSSGYMQSVRGELANRIAREMLKTNCITFMERRSPMDGGMSWRPGEGPPMVMEAVTGIVWPEGREIERIVESFDPVFDTPKARGGAATSRGFTDPNNPDPYDDYRPDPDPDVGLGMRASQTRKSKSIKLQRNPGRELIFEDEVKRDDQDQ